jgi:hypothetical protein
VTLTPAFLPLSESVTRPPDRERLSHRDRGGSDISDVLAVCDVLSPVRNLELLYSSETFDNHSPSLSHTKEPLRYLYLPKSDPSHHPRTTPYPSSPTSAQEIIGSHDLKEISQEAIENPEFQFGLSLLQANILVLCIKSGVDPKSLYPPEALLLNLDILQQHAIKHLSSHTSLTSGTSDTTTADTGEEEFNVENFLNFFLPSLPESLQRIIDPYPSLDLEHITFERDISSSIEVEDGIYVFSDDEINFEDQSGYGQSPDIVGEEEMREAGGEGLSHGEIRSPMREYEEKGDDGQDWAFVSEMMAERGDHYY